MPEVSPSAVAKRDHLFNSPEIKDKHGKKLEPERFVVKGGKTKFGDIPEHFKPAAVAEKLF